MWQSQIGDRSALDCRRLRPQARGPSHLTPHNPQPHEDRLLAAIHRTPSAQRTMDGPQWRRHRRNEAQARPRESRLHRGTSVRGARRRQCPTSGPGKDRSLYGQPERLGRSLLLVLAALLAKRLPAAPLTSSEEHCRCSPAVRARRRLPAPLAGWRAQPKPPLALCPSPLALADRAARALSGKPQPSRSPGGPGPWGGSQCVKPSRIEQQIPAVQEQRPQPLSVFAAVCGFGSGNRRNPPSGHGQPERLCLGRHHAMPPSLNGCAASSLDP